jgi:hypothetical protein
VRTLLALTAAVLLAGCGGGATTETVTVSETETEEATAGGATDAEWPPEPVRRTQEGLLEAAQSGEVDALAPYVTDRLSYSFGGPVEGGAIAYWKQLEAEGEDPLGTLVKVLSLPWTLAQGNYVWPWVYTVPRSDLTDYETQLLGDLADDFDGSTYLGWRAGIAPDGTWIFFVAGD